MSFGFSIGDFIAVGSIIATIQSSLREADGSKSDYQELLRELESLQRVLSHLDKLQPSDSSPMIKYTALSCRFPLEQFLSKIKKYDKSLGVRSERSTLRSAADKLLWAFEEKDEIRKLQSYLHLHVGTINILLTADALEKMHVNSKQVKADQWHVRERLEDTRKAVDRIKNSINTQVFAVQATHSMLSRLSEMMTGEFMTSWKLLGEMVTKIFGSTQQVYSVILEIKDSLALGDTRWTHFQAPLIVEDALGVKFPVPSECNYRLLDMIVKDRFIEGPGASDVEAGNYELFNTKNSKQIVTANTRLLPGTSITMAILIIRPEMLDEQCPMPRCRSTETTAAPGGGRHCCECHVRFDKSSKKLNALQDAEGQEFQTSTTGKRKLDQDKPPRKRIKTSNREYISDGFKNVKWWPQEAAVQSGSISYPVKLQRSYYDPDCNSHIIL